MYICPTCYTVLTCVCVQQMLINACYVYQELSSELGNKSKQEAFFTEFRSFDIPQTETHGTQSVTKAW